MRLKLIALTLFFVITASSIYSQTRIQEDSVRATQLISKKIESLQHYGAVDILYMFSDGGTAVIFYNLNDKVIAVKSNYRGNRSSEFRKFNLSRADKINYSNCVSLVSYNSNIHFSNCLEFVHSFNTVFFQLSTNNGLIKGSFTSDCLSALETNDMQYLVKLYKRSLLQQF